MEAKALALAVTGLVLCVAFAALGWWGYGYKSKYEAEMTADWRSKAAAQMLRADTLDTELATYKTTVVNNAKVMNELQQHAVQSDAQRRDTDDLVQRLLSDAARTRPSPGAVSKAGSGPGPASPGSDAGAGRLGDLLKGAAAESRLCALRYNTLEAEIIPQLEKSK